jgi:hypothetical protein
MKYLPLLVLGLVATPAFADDPTVRAMPIPNESTAMPWHDAVCLANGNLMVKQTCSQNDPKLILVDDVSVPVKPLANETAIPGTVDVDLICTVQYDASLNDCKLADGVKVSKKDEDTAISQIDGKSRVREPFRAGVQVQEKVVLQTGKALPVILLR